MSRWHSLNQARAKASSNAAGSLRNRSEILRYSGSILNAMSAVVIIVGTRLSGLCAPGAMSSGFWLTGCHCLAPAGLRSEEHTSELQSLMRISYAVFCLKKKKKKNNKHKHKSTHSRTRQLYHTLKHIQSIIRNKTS